MLPSHKPWIPFSVITQRVVQCIVAISCIALMTPRVAAQSNTASGHWEGTLEFRGQAMPIRIHIQDHAGSAVAALDLPGLIMSGHPIAAIFTNTGASLVLPFGLDTIAVEFDSESAKGTREFGEHTMTMRLVRGTPPPYGEEDVSFKSDGTVLAGTLVLPAGPGPYPSVVLLHGSGRQGKESWAYRSWADLLARLGLAVLYYDKRGVGMSEGEYDAGLRQLADDGAAAVNYLRSRPEIDPDRVGLKGSSQGAWLAEQVASDLGNVAFLLLVSAAAGTPRAQEVQKIEYGMRDDGRSEAEIESAIAYLGLYFYVARTGEGWSQLAMAIRVAQSEEWGSYVDQPRSEADLSWWRDNHAFQPAALVGNLSIPALLLYGGGDWICPPVENAQKLRGLFGSPELVNVHVFPDADHRLELDLGEDSSGVWQWMRVAPEVQPVVADWINKVVLQ